MPWRRQCVIQLYVMNSDTQAAMAHAGILRRARTEARSYDAQEEPARFAPQGEWAGARGGGSGNARRDKRGY